MIETDHPQAGRLRQARSPARFSTTPLDPPKPGRLLGADTQDVLAELGYDAPQIDHLIADGVATGPQEFSE